MGATKIEWTKPPGFAGATWNPLRGCSMVSSGCSSCYAMRQAHRHSGAGRPYDGLTRMTSRGPAWTGEVRLVPDALDLPLRRRAPTCWFVNSMSDLFHESVPDEFIASVFGVMASASHHRFIVLTKRPARMLAFFNQRDTIAGFKNAAGRAGIIIPKPAPENVDWSAGPLPNVWLGVSCEDQATADERIPLLLRTPAAKRLVSLEPLLGPVAVRHTYRDYLDGWDTEPVCCGRPRGGECCGDPDPAQIQTEHLDWMIVGGESGPGARPCDVEWIRDIVRQGRDAQVATFVKQLGARPIDDVVPPAFPWPPGTRIEPATSRETTRYILRDRKGGDPSEWPEDLRAREWPT